MPSSRANYHRTSPEYLLQPNFARESGGKGVQRGFITHISFLKVQSASNVLQNQTNTGTWGSEKNSKPSNRGEKVIRFEKKKKKFDKVP